MSEGAAKQEPHVMIQAHLEEADIRDERLNTTTLILSCKILIRNSQLYDSFLPVWSSLVHSDVIIQRRMRLS